MIISSPGERSFPVLLESALVVEALAAVSALAVVFFAQAYQAPFSPWVFLCGIIP